MKADNYTPINVLSIFKGFSRQGLQHLITPYRIHKKNGEVHRIKKIRQVTKHRVGGHLQYRYSVVSNNETYLHILFDTQTLSWRLIEQKEKDQTST